MTIKNQCLLVLFSISLVPSATLWAEEAKKPHTPTQLEGVEVVSPTRAKELLDQGQTLFVDVRKLIEYGEEHIPGAIHVPYHEKSEKVVTYDFKVDQFDLNEISKDTKPNLLYYCNGPDCWKSMKASRWTIRNGIKGKKLYWFREGLPEWKRAGFQTTSGDTKE